MVYSGNKTYTHHVENNMYLSLHSESKKVFTPDTFVTGINPQEIRGTKTGVYVGLMTTEMTDYFERVPEKLTGYETIGAVRSMLANRLSFQYDFKGTEL